MNNDELINTIREVVRSEVRSEISGLKDDVSELKVKVDENTASLDSLNKKVGENTAKLDSLNKKVNENTASLDSLNKKVNENNVRLDKLNITVDRIDNRQKGIFEQTAGLLEFRTIVNDKLNNLSEDIDYLKHKEQQNERDIFTLKKKVN